MTIGVILLSLLSALVKCSGEGNIRLLEDEVAVALKACADPTDASKNGSNVNQRQRRSDDFPRLDNTENNTGLSQYSHERRNVSDIKEQIFILNATDYDYGGYGAGNEGEKLVPKVPSPTSGSGYYNSTEANVNRRKRSELEKKENAHLYKPNNDQCLSQCVFANLQVVDSRGIPREAELWNKVQSSVTSQQSRAALRDQIRACFQELQSEAEDNGCSYSNKLERCLMLRFSDRNLNGHQENDKQKT